MRQLAPSLMPSYGPSLALVQPERRSALDRARSRAGECLHIPFRRLAVLLALLSVTSAARAQSDKDTCLAAHERAQVERLQGHLLEARAGLAICAQRSCPRLVSKDCTTWLAEVEAAQPTVVFTAVDEEGRALEQVRVHARGAMLAEQLDGRPVALDPGPLVVRYEAKDREPVEQQLTLHEGEKDRVVRAVLRPVSASVAVAASPPSPRAAAESVASTSPPRTDRAGTRWRRASYVLGGAAIAAFAVTAGSGIRGLRMLEHCDDEGCSDPYRERGKTMYRMVNVSAITGGVLLVSGLGALWAGLARRPERERASRSFSVYADGRSAALSLHAIW